jgi:hypothetical protein
MIRVFVGVKWSIAASGDFNTAESIAASHQQDTVNFRGSEAAEPWINLIINRSVHQINVLIN